MNEIDTRLAERFLESVLKGVLAALENESVQQWLGPLLVLGAVCLGLRFITGR